MGKTHVYPQIGALLMRDVKPKHVAEVVTIARNKKLAPRTVRNVYAIIQALFRDAEIEGLVTSNPCILSKAQLGTKARAREQATRPDHGQTGPPAFGLMAAITKSMKARTFAAGKCRDGYSA